MKKVFYVYKITCLCDEWNGKFYIGSHYGYVNDNYTGSGRKIKEYFKLYSKNGTYTKEILETSDDELYIKDKERELIAKHINEDDNLNLAINASKTTLGRIFTTETKEKMREKRHQRITTDVTKNRIALSNKGKTRTIETLKRMSDATKLVWIKRKAVIC